MSHPESSPFSSPLDAALAYAERGWPVFPCGADKTPLISKADGGNGFHDATVDRDQIVAWWRRHPQAQIGVACGAAHICVIDLDEGRGPDGRVKTGIRAFEVVKDSRPDWCELVATTPRGGRHLVYLMPDPPVASATNLLPDGWAPGSRSDIDVRAEGGYIVVPSPASPGRAWITGDLMESELTSMPEWVEALVRGGRRQSAGQSAGGSSSVAIPLSEPQVAAIRRALAFVDSDPRDTWIRVGMALKSTSAGQQAYDLWDEWSRTSPRFASFDTRKHVHQWESIREFRLDGTEVTIATLFHLAKQGGYVPPIEDEMVVETAPAPAPAPAPTPKRPFPMDLMNCPGLVGEVADWMRRSSRRQQPAMCLASALVTMGAVLGRRVATATDLRTNVYALGIGETACGKDPTIRLPHLLLTRADLGWAIGPGEWKSDSGLRAWLSDYPSHAAYIDEFTKVLASMSGPRVPGHVAGIKTQLLTLWAASNGVHLAAGYADRRLKPPTPIEQPNLCVYGAGVPAELFTSLDRGALSDGFLNRILIFFADDQQPPIQDIARAEPPEALVARLKSVEEATRCGNLGGLATASNKVRVLPFTADAAAMLEQLERDNDVRIRELRERGEPLSDLWVRFGAHIAKLALIRTASDDPTREISVHDVEWARDLVVWCLERTMAEAEQRVADSLYEGMTKRVLRLVVDGGVRGIAANKLTRATQWLRRGDRKDILQTLVDSGQIVCEESQPAGAGRPATVYAATQFRPQAAIPSLDVMTEVLT